MNALFICGKARMRSPTAADMAAKFPGVQSDFAGLSQDADERLSIEHIRWADIIFVMERRQKKKLTAQFSKELKDIKIQILDIPDRFEYMDDALVALLKPKLESALP